MRTEAGVRGRGTAGGEPRGILGWGVHLPCWRLDRATIAAVAGGGGGRGTRAVAAYDEDATTLAVGATRAATAAPGAPPPASLWFATVAPPYLDKTNATAVHAALRLGRDVPAYDCIGSIRSALGALRAGLGGPGPALVVAADLRTGRPGSADEAGGGDGAAALMVGSATDGPLVAELLAWASSTEELLDRWRRPGESWSGVWEERFGEVRYVALAGDAWSAALARAGLDAGEVDRVVIAGTHQRALAGAARALGVRPDPVAAEVAATVGDTGAAHPLLLLSAVLDEARPGEVVALIVLADGAEALLLRTTTALDRHRERRARGNRPVRAQLGGPQVAYGTYLAWRGFLPVEPPRRPPPARPSAAAAARSVPWKFGLVGTERDDGFVQLPPSALDGAARPMADALGTVVTVTVDHLAYSPHPPVVFAVVDFDGGGRMPVELTDVEPAQVAAGDRVEMTFRRLYTAEGIHNYFWKARPCHEATGASRAAGSRPIGGGAP